MTTIDQFIWCVVFTFIGGIIEPGDIKSIAIQGFPYKTVNAPCNQLVGIVSVLQSKYAFIQLICTSKLKSIIQAQVGAIWAISLCSI